METLEDGWNSNRSRIKNSNCRQLAVRRFADAFNSINPPSHLFLKGTRLTFLINGEFPNTLESLMTQSRPANGDVGMGEYVIPYNNPFAIDIITTL